MINLNDKKIRQKFVIRYLNAETTLEEERLLEDFLSNTQIILSDEEEDVLLLLQSSKLIGQSDITDEKAKEFDLLMQNSRNKKSTIVPMRWIASAAAAMICVVLFFPFHHTEKQNEQYKVAMVLPTDTDKTSMQDNIEVNTNETTENKVIVAEKTQKETADVARKTKKEPAHHANTQTSKPECDEVCTEKQIQTETQKAQDISTSELLETIHLLSEVGTNDIIITASSCSEGFVVKTSTSKGQSGSYTLKRCPDGTSIELQSQLINF